MNLLVNIASTLRDDKASVQLIYAFNSVGKTRLSVAYKDATKDANGEHTGIYYNAYSEDLFVWDNDIENDEANICLSVLPSSLSQFHNLLTENNIHEKLKPYKPNFDFRFLMHENAERGIKSITFFPSDKQPGEVPPIKISRGEERIFVWCFFLAMMEVESWLDTKTKHIFIDDPVSSLDDHNIFVTAFTIVELIKKYFKKRKIIITTHHVGIFSILCDWLLKGEKSSKYNKEVRRYILSMKNGVPSLEPPTSDVLLYHLRLLQLLEKALNDNDVRAYHFAMLRQFLETISSFLGVGRVGYVLEKIGFEDNDKIIQMVNVLSHKNVYRYDSDLLVPENLDLFSAILTKLKTQYAFVTHIG